MPNSTSGRSNRSQASDHATVERAGESSRLSRSAVVIGFVSLMSDISTEMAYPLLPAFITVTLGAPAAALGLIEGIAQGASSVITGASGWLSDRVGKRKPIALIGYLMTALSKPLIALAGTWQVVLAARAADRLGKGIRSAPKDAMLADSSAEEVRGRAFGFERAMDSAGAVLGPFLALLLIEATGFGTRSVLAMSALPAAIAVLLMLSLREPREKKAASTVRLRFSLAGTTDQYRRLLLIVGVFGLANSANSFLILRAQQLGLSQRSALIAYALYNAVAAIGSMPAGKASDRYGRRGVLTIGYAVYAAVYLGFALSQQAWTIWLLFAVYGVFPALTDGVAKALAVDVSGNAGRATAVGVLSSVVGVTQIVASYAGGLLWDLVDPRATFYFGAALAAMAGLLAPLLLRRSSR